MSAQKVPLTPEVIARRKAQHAAAKKRHGQAKGWARQRERLKERRVEDPAFDAKMRERERQRSAERVTDPDYHAHTKARKAALIRKKRTDPEWVAAQQALHQQRMQDPAYREAYERRYRDKRLMRYYGITLATWEDMLAQQNGMCGICGDVLDLSRINRIHVDHDHATNKVRGLLCYHCNVGLGSFHDDPKRLRGAIAYLNHHSNAPLVQSALF